MRGRPIRKLFDDALDLPVAPLLLEADVAELRDLGGALIKVRRLPEKQFPVNHDGPGERAGTGVDSRLLRPSANLDET